VGQEVVAHEETQKHEVVDDTLEVERERKLQILELQIQVLSDYVELDELELDGLGERDGLLVAGALRALRHQVPLLAAPRALLLKLGHEGLPDHAEIGLVRAQPKHYQIRVRSVNAVTSVGVVRWLRALRSDKVEYLVFSLSWDGRV
jgi:hypothetical protein